jgi:hypothetical protein
VSGQQWNISNAAQDLLHDAVTFDKFGWCVSMFVKNFSSFLYFQFSLAEDLGIFPELQIVQELDLA